MGLNEKILKDIITTLDPTKSVAQINDVRSLVGIAKQVVTRALQNDPTNENLLNANAEVLRIEKIVRSAPSIEIVRMRVPVVRTMPGRK